MVVVVMVCASSRLQVTPINVRS